jgi:hypothetical protein
MIPPPPHLPVNPSAAAKDGQFYAIYPSESRQKGVMNSSGSRLMRASVILILSCEGGGGEI